MVTSMCLFIEVMPPGSANNHLVGLIHQGTNCKTTIASRKELGYCLAFENGVHVFPLKICRVAVFRQKSFSKNLVN